jgi:ABC-2 type transport system permease protein
VSAPDVRPSSPSPAPATRAANPATRVRSQAAFDAATILRNGEQLLVTIVLPALALVGLTLAPVPEIVGHPRVDVVVPGVFALAILSSAFTGQAIATAFDRRYGVLRLLGTTPLGRGGFLAGRVLAVLAIQALQFAALAATGLALGWRPGAGALPGFFAFWLVGGATFTALALLFAGVLRAEAVLALANLAWAVMAGAGGVLFGAERYPGPWNTLVAALPPGALGDGMRAAFLEHTIAWGPLGVLAAWGAVFAIATVRTFRWSD